MPTEYRVLWDGAGAVSIIVEDMNIAIELARRLRAQQLKNEQEELQKDQGCDAT